MAAIVLFGFLLSRPIAQLPSPGLNGRTTPIEAVMERLNGATTTSDTLVSDPEEALKAASAGEAIAWKGTLTDAFGRPVRSAEIHLIGGHGELVASTATDGSFAFSEFPSGNYEVAVVLGGREVGYLKALHLSSISSPSRLTLASGGRLLVSQHGR
jgi:hypothetical protein